MIVPMKKVSIIIPAKDKREFLLRLRREGVLHIEQDNALHSEELIRIGRERELVQNALSALPDVEIKQPVTATDEKDIIGKAQDILSHQEEIGRLAEKIRKTEGSISFYRDWGRFSPEDIRAIAGKGVHIKLYLLNKKELREAQKKAEIQVIKRRGRHFYTVCLFYGKGNALSYKEIIPPSESPVELANRLEGLKKQAAEKKRFLKENSALKNAFSAYLRRLEKEHRFLNALYSMKDKERLAVIEGFCPAYLTDRIKSLAKKCGAGWIADNPAGEEDVPTLIKNPRWINIINPIFKFMNTVPGYSEFDISMVFLIFFSLFFAMLIGDAGYGLLFIASTWILRKRFRSAPPEPFRLIYLLGFTTLVWGAVTGVWFGFENIARLRFFNSVVIGRINGFADTNQDFMIYICFVIGAVQLSIAHIMRALKVINSLRSAAQAGWVCIIWGLFFTAGTLVLNRPFPHFAGYMFSGGILAVLLFSNPNKNIFRGILASLSELPLSVISSFSDVVSYLRLFAVGFASVIVSSSFNKMAVDAGFGTFLSGFGAALILVFGHTLNIILGLMAVVVHGIRLNMLEFSGHLNMQWSGKEYSPFKE